MPGVEAPVLRVELIWDAGRPFENKKLQAGATADMLVEGTRHRSAGDLEGFFEQFGTALAQPDLMDTANLSLSTIIKHAGKVFPVMAEVIAEPAFDEASFRKFMKRRKQQLREGLSDNDTLAFRLITESVFGPDHPYGYNGYKENYAKLTLEDIRNFHKSHFHAGNATLYVAGHINREVEALLERTFGQLPTGPRAIAPTLPATPAQPQIIQVLRPRAQQTMIRRGRRGIHIGSEDYGGLVILETIFGGYFSSRLMKNIREEKGYTYGIDSELDTYRYDGSFGVSADVANETLGAVRHEIDIEIDKLLQHPVPTAELDMVRAYLAGSISMELDGPFGHGFRHRSALIKGYDPAALLRNLNDAIRDISPAEIQDLAQQYLSKGDDFEVILGGADLIEGAQKITATDQPLQLTAGII
ncbi:insulinase family protein [Neolewinella aurantiaca]|uniref:Insulinase family protein n=1 Tax=Neolewinella aurantiaca TaxID=2602767 RepID=A0A5C7FGN8_9BACT|nr:pitrilysin family protein [Neolewinella aurantiaca]TXF88885.1 insulinase family protein [Neolewinella aurantiaca]